MKPSSGNQFSTQTSTGLSSAMQDLERNTLSSTASAEPYLLDVPCALPKCCDVPGPSERIQEAPRLDQYPPAYLWWGWGAGAGHITYAGQIRLHIATPESIVFAIQMNQNPH